MAAQDTIQYLTVPDYATNSALAAQQNMRIETLSRIRRTLVTERPRGMEDCVVWARYGRRMKYCLVGVQNYFPILSKCEMRRDIGVHFISVRSILMFGF
jgi:hypothetical protein